MTAEGSRNVNRRIRATGPEQARQLLAMLRSAFPDAKFSIEKRVEDERGDVAFVVSARGTHSGEVEGYAPTGAPANIVVISNITPRPGSKESAT